MSIARQDYDRDAFVVPLKNLGLGPARLIALQIKDADGNVFSARIGPGLAPMESEEWIMLSVGWDRLDLPTIFDLDFEGSCEDATGQRHPIHFLGGEPIPFPAFDFDEAVDVDEVARGGLQQGWGWALKAVGRSARDGDDVGFVFAWLDYWTRAQRDGVLSDGFVAEVRAYWDQLGAPPERFKTLAEAEAQIAAWNEGA
jgi:hypothetical protein